MHTRTDEGRRFHADLQRRADDRGARPKEAEAAVDREGLALLGDHLLDPAERAVGLLERSARVAPLADCDDRLPTHKYTSSCTRKNA